MRVLNVLLFLLVSGCAGTGSFVRDASTDQQIAACTDLDSARRTWEAISAASKVAAGSGGIIAALYDAETPRLAIGLTSASIAIMSTLADYLSNDYAETYADHGCTTLRE
jgi:hypothetical protein